MDRKDYQYIHNSLGKNNQVNTASRANNYIHNLLPKINSQNIIYDNTEGSGITDVNGEILKLNKKDLSGMIIEDTKTHKIKKYKESGAVIFCDYKVTIDDNVYNKSRDEGTLIFCAWLQAKTTYILNCLNRYKINYRIQPIRAFILNKSTSESQNDFYYFDLTNIGNSNEDSYCYFYNKEECLMAFYIPNCAPADNLIINNTIADTATNTITTSKIVIPMTNVKPPLETAVQLIASEVPYTLDLNEQITGINNITPYSKESEENVIQLQDIVKILNETPVELTVNDNNIIRVAQIKNQTVIDFLKNNTFEVSSDTTTITYPRYQLVLIPWRDFLTERECSSRKSTWKYVPINEKERQRQLTNNYKIFNSRYTCLFGHPYYESQNRPLDFSYLMSTLPKCNMPFEDNTDITCLKNTEIAYWLAMNNSGAKIETGEKLITPLKWKKLSQDNVNIYIHGLYFNLTYKDKNQDDSFKYKLPRQGYVNPLVVASRLEKGCGLIGNKYKNINVYYGFTPKQKNITYKEYAALSFSWGLIDMSHYYKNDKNKNVYIRNLDKLAEEEYELPFTKIWWHGNPELLPYNFIGSMSKPIIVPFNKNVSNINYHYIPTDKEDGKNITVENTKFESIECIKLKNSQ